MKKTTKKTLAREFLILLGSSILFFIIIFSWDGLNSLNYNKRNRLQNELKELSQNETTRLLDKFIETEKTYNKWSDVFDDFPEFKKLKEEALKDYYETVMSNKYKNDRLKLQSKFPEFGFSNYGLPNDVNELEYKEKESKLKKLKNSFFNSFIDDDEILGVGIFILSLFFALRYLIYATKWSFKQLKD